MECVRSESSFSGKGNRGTQHNGRKAIPFEEYYTSRLEKLKRLEEMAED